MLLIMIFGLDAETGRGHAAVSTVSKGRRQKLNHEEIITYPIMYERVVNQLFSTESRSVCLTCEALAQAGLEEQLTGETSVREKVNETHIAGVVCLREGLLGEDEGVGGKREKGWWSLIVVCCEEIAKSVLN
jgi:hypothetical protein